MVISKGTFQELKFIGILPMELWIRSPFGRVTNILTNFKTTTNEFQLVTNFQQPIINTYKKKKNAGLRRGPA